MEFATVPPVKQWRFKEAEHVDLGHQGTEALVAQARQQSRIDGVTGGAE